MSKETYDPYDLCVKNIPNDMWEGVRDAMMEILPEEITYKTPSPVFNKRFKEGLGIAWYINVWNGNMGYDWMTTYNDQDIEGREKFDTVIDYMEVWK